MKKIGIIFGRLIMIKKKNIVTYIIICEKISILIIQVIYTARYYKIVNYQIFKVELL